MKPMHGEFKRISRCPCCQSKYSTRSVRYTPMGKRVARQNAKKQISKELNDRV
jgi:hypothetical protein